MNSIIKCAERPRKWHFTIVHFPFSREDTIQQWKRKNRKNNTRQQTTVCACIESKRRETASEAKKKTQEKILNIFILLFIYAILKTKSVIASIFNGQIEMGINYTRLHNGMWVDIRTKWIWRTTTIGIRKKRAQKNMRQNKACGQRNYEPNDAKKKNTHDQIERWKRKRKKLMKTKEK